MGNNYQNEETEIDLVEMFFYVLKKWKVLVIWGIVGLIIGCGFSYYKMVQMDPANLESYFAKLEDDHKINKDNITIYRDYQALYDGLLESGKDSVILNMNPNAVYSATVTYYYSCDDIDELEAILNSLLDSDRQETLRVASGLDCKKECIKDLVNVWFYKSSTSNLIIDTAYMENKQSGKLSVSIVAPSEEALTGMLNQLQVMIYEKNVEIKDKFGKFEFGLLNKNESFGYSSTVSACQNTFVNERVSYLKNATTYKDKLSDDEKLYIAYYYPDENTELETGFSKKYPFFVAVGLAFVSAVWYAVVFIFDSHIKCECDLGKKVYVIAYLGSKKKGLDRIFDNWSNCNKPDTNDEEYVLDYLVSLKNHRTALCYGDSDKSINKLAESIKAKLGDKVVLVGNVAIDVSKEAMLQNVDKVVEIVKLYETRKSTHNRIQEVCLKNGIEISEAIIIR